MLITCTSNIFVNVSFFCVFYTDSCIQIISLLFIVKLVPVINITAGIVLVQWDTVSRLDFFEEMIRIHLLDMRFCTVLVSLVDPAREKRTTLHVLTLMLKPLPVCSAKLSIILYVLRAWLVATDHGLS
jgi:hypothetical protein